MEGKVRFSKEIPIFSGSRTTVVPKPKLSYKYHLSLKRGRGAPLLLKNWRINRKERERKSDSIQKRGREGTINSYIFTRRKRKKIKREPLKRDPCYWATRHTALWPTDRLYSHTILPPASSRRYLSRSLPFFLSQRLRPSATIYPSRFNMQIFRPHVMRNEARLFFRV